MAKLTLASPETQKMVQEIALELGLTQMGVEFQAFKTDKAKEVVKVQKASQVTEILSNKETLVIVTVYEDAFDKVEDKDAYLWLRQALATVSYDSEKEKVTIGCPMVSVPLHMLQKYGNVVTQNAELAIHTIQILEEEARIKKEVAKQLKLKKKKKF